MKAMILAAGYGERMRPLTDNKPKPLLHVGGKCLIEYHIEALVRAGFTEIVINHAKFGACFERELGDGKRYNASIVYSTEGERPLETGGGILKALPLLGDSHFIVVNGDIWTNYNFEKISNATEKLGHLVLVNNPPHHTQGDFVLNEGQVFLIGDSRLTFSGIGVYHPDFFSSCNKKAFQLAELLNLYIAEGQVTGEHFTGSWYDIGTPQRLWELDHQIKKQQSCDAPNK